MEEKDTLKKFGAPFQTKCLAGILTDKPFLERIMDIVLPDYFDNDAHKWLLTETIEYFQEYKSIPTMDVFKIKLDDVDDKVLKQSIIEHLRAIYSKANDTDLVYIREQFLEFCKNRTLKTAINESIDLLQTGEYDEIRHKVDSALKAGMEKDDGHDYMVELDARLSEDARDTVKTQFESIDDLLDGGLGPGELGVVTACAGAGKSWVLTKIGQEALKAGKNVIHITLELPAKYVGRRYDCCFTGIEFQNIIEHKQEIEAKLKGVDGWLKIKYFPIKTVSAFSVKNYVERIQTLTGEKCDLLIVDYADILKPVTANRNANSYSEAGGIYEELRGAAGELQVPVWTASQSNRGASSNDIIEADSISDSYMKIMIADFVMSLSRRTDDKLQNTGRFHVIKNRFGPDGITFPAFMDCGCGDIKIYDATSDEGKALSRKMDEDGDDATKNYLKDKFDAFQDKSDNSKNSDMG